MRYLIGLAMVTIGCTSANPDEALAVSVDATEAADMARTVPDLAQAARPDLVAVPDLVELLPPGAECSTAWTDGSGCAAMTSLPPSAVDLGGGCFPMRDIGMAGDGAVCCQSYIAWPTKYDPTRETWRNCGQGWQCVTCM